MSIFLDIPLSQAFAWCATQASWWWTILPTGIVFAAIIYYFIKQYKTTGSTGYVAGVVALIIVWSIIFMAKPEDVSTNTTPDQVARGVHIG